MDYSAKQVAEKCNINIVTVYRLVQSGKLKAYNIGGYIRITPDDLEEFKAKSRVDAPIRKA